MRSSSKVENTFLSWIKTTFYFIAFLLLLPFILAAFSVVTLYHKLKLLLLSKRFRYLDFARSNTIRSLIDTSKNPGILIYLLKIKGKCDLEEIRNAYQQHLLEKTDRNGKFLYPRLRAVLISCFGQYAFVKNFDEFKVENHILLGPTCDENNVQQCISSIVSKYMPSDIPAWQFKLIPLKDGSAFYLLMRIHHLILDEQKNLNIGDMMLLDRSRGMRIVDAIPEDQKFLTRSPIEDVIKTPLNLITIYEDILDFFISYWNDFVMKHDSLDHHDGFGQQPEHLSDLCSSLSMAALNTYIEYKQSSKAKGSSDPQLHFRFISNAFSQECQRRKISIRLAFNLLLKTFHPFNIIKNVTLFMLRTFCLWLILAPIYFLRELNELRKYLLLREDLNRNSLCGFLIIYTPLLYGSLREIFYFLEIIYTAPRMFIEETFMSRNGGSHYLNAQLCGRKHVAWSDPIEIDILHGKALRNRQTYSELMLSAISSCLRTFFEELEAEGKIKSIPASIKFNMRNVPYSYLFGTRHYRKGILGIDLPVQKPSIRQFVAIRDQIQETQRHQAIIYIMSIIQMRFDFLTTAIPSIWLKLIINFLSKKFSISISEVYGIHEFEPVDFKTYYKSEIEDVIYFRTPQSNNSTSITIQRFKDKIRVNLICDSSIENYQSITKNFKTAFLKIPLVKRV